MRIRLKLASSVSCLALAFGTVIGATMPAKAEDDWYVSLFAGVSQQDGTNFQYFEDPYHLFSKTGFTLGGTVGTILLPGLRGELEFSVQNQDGKRVEEDVFNNSVFPLNGDVTSYFVLANLWKELELGPLRPYLGGGIGAGIVDFDLRFNGLGGPGQGFKDTTLGFAAQLGAGIRVPVTEKLALDFAYRLKGVVTPFIEASLSTYNYYHAAANVFSHSAQVGFTYVLGENRNVEPASADDSEDGNFYVSLFGGGAFQEVHNSNFSGTYVYKILTKDGFTVGGAVGTSLAPGLRGELEVSYVHNKATGYTDLSNEPPADHPSRADHHQLYFLANIWKDIGDGRVTPYVGAGIGFGLAGLDGIYNINNPVSGTANRRFNDFGVGLAAQFGAGLRVAVTDRVSLEGGYRFKGILGAVIESTEDDATTVNLTNHVAQIGAIVTLGPAAITPAATEGGDKSWYTSLFAGGAFTQNAGLQYVGYVYETRFKSGFTLGAAVGTEVLPTVRGELEASYLRYAAKDVDYGYAGSIRFPLTGHVNNVLLLGNLWKDFHLGGGFSPYIGGGIGMAVVDSRITQPGLGTIIDDTTVALAGQIGSGLRYRVSDTFSLDVGYRLKSVLNAILEQPGARNAPHNQFSWYTHVVQGGISFHLD